MYACENKIDLQFDKDVKHTGFKVIEGNNPRCNGYQNKFSGIKQSFIPYVLLGVFLVSILTIQLFLDQSNFYTIQSYEWSEKVVKKRETLWDIAKQCEINNLDIRSVVHSIKTQNGLTESFIKPGQKILVPLKQNS